MWNISILPLGIFSDYLDYKESSMDSTSDGKNPALKFQDAEEEFLFIWGKIVKKAGKIVVFSFP